MTTDQELPLDGQSTTALFTAKGIDVTPNKDQGVIKVLYSQTLKCSFLKKASKLLLKLDVCRCRLWSIQDTLETDPWSETEWPSITPGGCWTGRCLTALTIARSLLASALARVNRTRCKPSLNIPSYGLSKGLTRISCVGQVLKAWDVGISSMERGEVAVFLCKPEYAYGVVGNPNKIPPNSAVVFEVGAASHTVCFNPFMSKISHMGYEFCVHLLSQEGSQKGFRISSVCSYCSSSISVIWLCDTPTCFSFVYCLFLHPRQHQVKQSLGFYLVLYNCAAQRLNPRLQQNRSSCLTSTQKNSPTMEASCEE